MLMCGGKGVGTEGEAENHRRKEAIISGLKGTRQDGRMSRHPRTQVKGLTRDRMWYPPPLRQEERK